MGSSIKIVTFEAFLLAVLTPNASFLAVLTMTTKHDDGREAEFISTAARLSYVVNDPERFTPSLCLYAVSGDQVLAERLSSIKAVESAILVLKEQNVELFSSSDHDLAYKQRCYEVTALSCKLPNLHKYNISAVGFSNFRSTKTADVMRLLGSSEEQAGNSGKLYRAVDRYIKKIKAAATNPVLTAAGGCGIPIEIDIDDDDHDKHCPWVSVTSTVSTLTTFSSSPGASSSTTVGASKPKPSSSANRSDFVKLTTLPETRRTTNEKQTARTEEQAWIDIRSISYKVGSIIYDGVQRGRCPLKKFSSAENIVHEVNNLFGCETISGGDLRRSYRDNNTAKSPPRQGPATRIDDDAFALIAQLVFTCQTIEQVNCTPNRLKRPQLISEVGAIVNAKLKADNKDELNEVRFFECIQLALSREVVLTAADPRELLRAMWLTYENQNLNHIRWEQTVVDLGFGRLAASDIQRKEHGNVVLYPGQAQRIVQVDEMGFSSDGSKNGMGGHPGALLSNANVPETGTPVNKSSGRTSWLFGVNFADEALPPLAVFASSAVTPKFKGHYLRNMHQVEGVFGFPARLAFASSFAASENGSVTNKIFLAWLQETIVGLYPDAADEPGNRVLLKVDTGPGRFYSDFRCVSREHGIYTFPGVPNGTEIGQEMDQLFGNLKTRMQKNHQAVFQKQYELIGDKAQVSPWDTPFLLFGSAMPFAEDGSTLDLPNSFALAMDPDLVQRARVKCGYIPATRASLQSAKLRHEMFVDGDGNVNDNLDPYSSILQQVELQNEQAVTGLTEQGYELAKNLKRSVRQVNAARQEARCVVTIPNTRARREKLVGISHAGEWFKQTNGGLPMNGDDAIIALEMQRLKGVAA
jgi:hypothetical protein